jgi:hydroxypyruvate isomerase
MFPYEHETAVVERALEGAGVENVLFNLPAGDWARGDRGLACVPGRESEFRESVSKALTYARFLKAPLLHAMAGNQPSDADRAACEKTYVSNLRYAAEKVGEAGKTLVIEPINTRDMPGYFLNTQAQAAQFCEQVGAPNIKIQMDCYHMQIAEGDLSTNLRAHANRCGHVQIASAPDRHEPDHGEINYSHIFALLDEIGYSGWVGCEYRPAGKTTDGLAWAQSWLSPRK